MPKTNWRVIPDNITLSDSDNWLETKPNHYQATRFYLAIVERRANKPKTSPALVNVSVPPGAKPVVSDKKITVFSYTEAITETIQSSVTSKLATESSFKNAASLKEGISAEVQTKISTEISTGLSSQFSSTKTYQVQSTHEVVNSISFEAPQNSDGATKSQFYLYLPVWPVTWNLYLYRIETLALSYDRFHFDKGVLQFFKQVRNIEPLEILDPKLPLAQFVFYQPQDVLVPHAGDYEPEVVSPDDILVQPLTEPSSILTVPTQTMSLEACASVAFPETEEESEMRNEARQVNKARKKSPLRAELETEKGRIIAGGGKLSKVARGRKPMYGAKKASKKVGAKKFATKKQVKKSAAKKSVHTKSATKRFAVKHK